MGLEAHLREVELKIQWREDAHGAVHPDPARQLEVKFWVAFQV